MLETEHSDLVAPLLPEITKTQQSIHHSVPSSTVANTTFVGLAAEFKKMREPKIQKLKGGNTASANLFLIGWIKEVKSIIKDRDLSDSEAIQLVEDFSESKARQQVDYYIDTCINPSFEGLLQHLKSAFSSGEDESTIKSKFYSRKQSGKESEDEYAETLQVLA